jgi:hypothetical protein
MGDPVNQNGFYDERFLPLRDLFQQNLDAGEELARCFHVLAS